MRASLWSCELTSSSGFLFLNRAKGLWVNESGVSKKTNKPKHIRGKHKANPEVTQSIRARVAVKTGRKWRAEVGVEQAESRLCHGVLVGTVARGRSGLGAIAAPRYNKARGKERRQLVQDAVRAAVEEERSNRPVGLRQLCAWTRWKKLWRGRPRGLNFGRQTRSSAGKQTPLAS